MASRMDAVQSPIIPVIGELIRAHPGTISLGQGVVYYGPPPEAIARISDFLAEPLNHRYQAVEGIPALREAIAAKLARFNGIPVGEATQTTVVVTAGGNMAFMNALLAITAPGDEVILLTPYYFNHEMAITMAGCRPVLVPTDAQYQPDLGAIARAITPRTRAVVTVSPNNPTGAVYAPETLGAVNALCRDRGLYHISDEAYDAFTYDGVRHCSPASLPGSSGHTISLYSLSKVYGFASWRIGYMVIPQALLDPVKKIQDTILICPPVVSQYAALGALEAGEAYWRPHQGAIAAVRHRVLDLLAPIKDQCAIAPAQGAFYFFLKVPTALPSLAVAERLIREHGVAVIPGSTFGLAAGCYLRVAYGALQSDTAAEGIQRLVGGIQAILAAEG